MAYRIFHLFNSGTELFVFNIPITIIYMETGQSLLFMEDILLQNFNYQIQDMVYRISYTILIYERWLVYGSFVYLIFKSINDR